MDSTHTDLLAVVVLLCVCVDRLGLTLSIACLPRAAGDPTLLPRVSASFDGEAAYPSAAMSFPHHRIRRSGFRGGLKARVD